MNLKIFLFSTFIFCFLFISRGQCGNCISKEKSVVFTVTLDGKLHAIDALNGDVLWSLDGGGSLLSFSRDTEKDGSLILMPSIDGHLFVYDSGKGFKRLKMKVHDIVDSFYLINNTTLQATTMKRLYSIDLSAGRLLHTQKISSYEPSVLSSCLNSPLYLPASASASSQKPELLVTNAESDENVKKEEFIGCPGLPLVLGRFEYTLSVNSNWRNFTVSEFHFLTDVPLINKDTVPSLVIALDGSHSLYKGTELIWKTSFNSPVISASLLSLGGAMRATVPIKYNFSLPDLNYAGPPRIYVGEQGGQLFALPEYFYAFPDSFQDYYVPLMDKDICSSGGINFPACLTGAYGSAAMGLINPHNLITSGKEIIMIGVEDEGQDDEDISEQEDIPLHFFKIPQFGNDTRTNLILLAFILLLSLLMIISAVPMILLFAQEASRNKQLLNTSQYAIALPAPPPSPQPIPLEDVSDKTASNNLLVAETMNQKLALHKPDIESHVLIEQIRSISDAMGKRKGSKVEQKGGTKPCEEFHLSASAPSVHVPWSLDFFPRYAYEFDEKGKLGSGGFGAVFVARNKLDDVEYAIKKIYFYEDDQATVDKAFREAKYLAKLDHQNIVRYFQSWLEKSLSPHPVPQDDEHGDDESTSSHGDEEEFTMSENESKVNCNKSTSESSCNLLFDNTSNTSSRNDAPHEKDSSSFSGLMFESDETPENSSCSSFGGLVFGSGDITRPEAKKIKSGLVEEISTPSQSDRTVTSEKIQRKRSGRKQEKNSIAPASTGQIYQTLYIQMQLCKRETLADWLSKPGRHVDVSTNWDIFHQIVSGLMHVHSLGLIHRDLKPSNIFSSVDGIWKIGDFGLSKYVLSKVEEEHENIGKWTRRSHTTNVGTPLYASPELEGKVYDEKVDIFSLGIILFEMFSPFRTAMERVMEIQSLRNSLCPSSNFQSLYPSVATMVKTLLAVDPKQRPSAQIILSIIAQVK